MTPYRPSSSTAAIVALFAATVLTGTARAQVVERNLPPAPVAPTAPEIAAPTVAPETDDRPIGPALTGIVLLGATETPRAGPVSGVVAAPTLRVGRPGDVRALSRLLGRPISRKLIGQAQAAVTLAYRRLGFPFVSVTTPEQEITGGVLQLRVVEFHAGQVKAIGGKRTPPGYVEGRVRTKPGRPIDAGALSEDLDWLNRNPYRTVQATFTPGQELGATDLNLAVTEARPYRLYGGYNQSGSQATGRDRWFLGGQIAGLPGLPDALSSYQFTGSQDAFGNDHPLYISHALRFSAPLAPRQQVEFTFDHVESNQPVQDFVLRSLTDEAALGWRGALSNLIPPSWLRLRGDVTLGVEARQSDRRLLFGGATATHAETDVFQVYTGYTGAFVDPFGSTSLNATLHVSPGGIDHRNLDAAFAAFSTGRVSSAAYAYVNAQASRFTPLPWRLSLSTEVIAQYAGAALPDTEQTAIGAPSLVRGYSLDDGAFDSGIVVRDTLNLPAFRLAPAKLALGDSFQPHLFVDGGYAYERVVRRDLTAVSTGFGADWRVGGRTQLGGDVSCPLRHGPFTRSGDCRVEGRLTLSY